MISIIILVIILTNMDYTNITLGELLSSNNETVKRNAISVLKQLQKKGEESIKFRVAIYNSENKFCSSCVYSGKNKQEIFDTYCSSNDGFKYKITEK